MMIKPLRSFILLGTASGLAACSSVPPPGLGSLPLPQASTPSAPSLAVLAPAPPASAASQPRVLTVRRIGIPEYAQADTVRYRLADNTQADWPNAAWAERLEVGMTNHLTLRLRQAMPGWTICDGRCPPIPRGLVLMVDMVPLDYVRPQKTLQAEVHWRVMGPDSATVPTARGDSAPSIPVAQDTPMGQAGAIGELLQRTAQEIAQALR